MKIHQSTFQRTLSRANKKLTNALVFGKAIKISGGNYNLTNKNKMANRDGTGPVNSGYGRGRGRRMGDTYITEQTGGICKCPKCGHTQEHTRAKPCNQIKCPKCEILMIRE